ncbi:MAG TPA: DUF3500 domain-containing protein [Candidatus Dormibacteraeota bacterium]|nr:DUF3500 domain-containing protein [Candidatus Dormibacteraeota bacterium]
MRVERRLFLRSSAALVGAGIMLGSGHGQPEQIHPHHVHAASRMTECANRFLAALDAHQCGKATFPFDSDERMNWHFIPKQRKGLPLQEMTPYQKHLASALLASGLSQTGYIKAVTIMSLEDVLKIIENDSGEHRNPEKYYVSVFGTPSDSGTWGYRVEGHHFSQNYTVVNGNVIDGPSFFGANPAEVRQGPRKGLRTLAGEEDLGIELIHMLDEQQQKMAIVDPTAYKDILTAASRKAALQGQPSGLAASKMNANQFDALRALMEEYARNVPDELAEGRDAQINKAGRNIHFAWSGGIDRGDPHYYRVQTPSFLIELDDTQDNANHIHSVWRDLAGDFGEDLLHQHYQASHQKKSAT